MDRRVWAAVLMLLAGGLTAKNVREAMFAGRLGPKATASVSVREATDIARRELARRAAHATVVECTAPGHGQVVVQGLPPTIYVPDTIAHVEHEPTGTTGAFLLVGCTYRSGRSGGETTELELLRRGVELTA